MRAVIDTNILVAAFLTPFGSPARVLDLVLSGDLIPVVDDRIIAEYRSVLLMPGFDFSASAIEAVLDLIREEGELIVAPPLRLTLPDPDDAAFVEVAIAAACRFLITGNRKHFPTRAMGAAGRQIKVISPRDFLELLPS